MIELVLYLFVSFYVLPTCLRVPPGLRVPQVEYHWSVLCLVPLFLFFLRYCDAVYYTVFRCLICVHILPRYKADRLCIYIQKVFFQHTTTSTCDPVFGTEPPRKLVDACVDNAEVYGKGNLTVGQVNNLTARVKRFENKENKLLNLQSDLKHTHRWNNVQHYAFRITESRA